MGNFIEVLSHARGAADLKRLNNGAPLLFNHNADDVLGVVVSAEIAADGRGRATVRFGRDDRGEWAMCQVADGILRNVSFAYLVNAYEPGSTPEEYVATSWTALEISIVTVPADADVGVGRSIPSKVNTMPIQRNDDTTTLDDEADGALHLSRRQRQRANNATEIERDRILEIQAACRTYNLGASAASRFIESGATIDQVRAAALERMTAGGARPVAALGESDSVGYELGLTPRETSSFSIVRAINAALSNDWSGAGFERECSRAMERKLGRPAKGFYVPDDVLKRSQWQQRAPYQVGTAVQGGNTVATNLLDGMFVDALRNTSQVANAGAFFLSGLQGNVDIPRRTAVTSTYWVAESGAITESEGTFDKISLRPKTVGALSKMSRLMLIQATPAIEMLVRGDLIAQMGLAIDLAAISGSGTGNQPTGIVNTAGIGQVVLGTNGANVSLDNLVALETALANSNAPLDTRGYLLNTKTIGTLKNLKATTGTYLWTDSAPGQRSGTPLSFNGYPVFSTNQCRSNLTKGTSTGVCSELVFGAFAELIIGQWGVLEILVNPYDSTGFTTGDVLIRAMQTIDIAVRHPASFASITDALTP